jgi:superfamily II DNA/RNA helicase
MSFQELGLSEDVLRAVADSGYVDPTPIQTQAIPVVLTGRDVLGCAQTGTGKTASFTLPMIDLLTRGRSRARMPRSLIIEPTRELAAQVAKSFDNYGKYHKLSKVLLTGGETFTDQERALDRGVDVLIATPGRLIDLYERGKIIMSDVRILVIDESDRMLDMGFIPDVERIVSWLPRQRQTLFFSATMPPEIRRLADAFLTDPAEISVAPPASPAATVEQALVKVRPDDKRAVLRALINQEPITNAIIFCNRKRDVDTLLTSLKRHGFQAAALHGDMPQHTRTATLDSFRAEEIKLLVASDVAARGLDIVHVSHIFNFDVPYHAEDYVHRIGRTGRAGRTGKSFTLATSEDDKAIAAIERLIGRDIPVIAPPEFPGEDADDEKSRRRASGGRSDRPAARGGRTPRGTSRARPEAVAAEAPEAPRVESPRPERARPERARPERARPASRPQAPIQGDGEAARRLTGAAVKDAPAQGRRQPRHEDDDESPLGLGDHVPAFLLRRGRTQDAA